MKVDETNYQRLKNLENEIILLLSKNITKKLREEIEEEKKFINEVLESIRENKNSNEEVEKLLNFLYGYNSNELIIKENKQIEKFKKLIKDGEEKWEVDS